MPAFRVFLVYGSEMWAMKVNDKRRLERVEITMLRWMCGVTLRDMVRSTELMNHFGIVCAEEVSS